MVKKLLTIRALTSLHPGSGTGIGVIDMPIQRERHTGYPTIPGSSIKGVLRQVSRVNNGISKETIFGPENREGEKVKYASSASFSDARIFAFPVRSLKGVFAWVTCPEVIRRLKNEGWINCNIQSVQDQQIICSGDIAISQNNENKVILEEYDFTKINGAIDNTIIEFGKKFFSDENDKNAFAQRFAIISDNDFAHFVRYATEVNARIALVPNTKNARDGALFYEEFLPSETLFYSTVIFENSRKDGDNTTAEEIAKALQIPNPVQFGGDETIGKGFCEVHLI